jgi:hypothetical protein
MRPTASDRSSVRTLMTQLLVTTCWKRRRVLSIRCWVRRRAASRSHWPDTAVNFAPNRFGDDRAIERTSVMIAGWIGEHSGLPDRRTARNPSATDARFARSRVLHGVQHVLSCRCCVRMIVRVKRRHDRLVPCLPNFTLTYAPASRDDFRREMFRCFMVDLTKLLVDRGRSSPLPKRKPLRWCVGCLRPLRCKLEIVPRHHDATSWRCVIEGLSLTARVKRVHAVRGHWCAIRGALAVQPDHRMFGARSACIRDRRTCSHAYCRTWLHIHIHLSFVAGPDHWAARELPDDTFQQPRRILPAGTRSIENLEAAPTTAAATAAAGGNLRVRCRQCPDGSPTDSAHWAADQCSLAATCQRAYGQA